MQYVDMNVHFYRYYGERYDRHSVYNYIAEVSDFSGTIRIKSMAEISYLVHIAVKYMELDLQLQEEEKYAA